MFCDQGVHRRPCAAWNGSDPRPPSIAGMDPPAVELIAVDDAVLDELVRAATTAAAADEVTPPAGSRPGWNAERVAWLTAFHRGCRDGLDSPSGAATWAVRSDGEVVGGVRLRWVDPPGTVETGIWLTAAARGRGDGRRAVGLVAARAAAAGAAVLRADTTAANGAALAVLRGLGFTLDGPDASGAVVARLDLR